jgi:hypothetical protein
MQEYCLRHTRPEQSVVTRFRRVNLKISDLIREIARRFTSKQT